MIGELQMIFGVHTVVVELRIARHLFVFFEHLARVAARTVVDAVVVVKTASVVLLAVVAVAIVVIATATPVIIVRLATVVGIHKG